MVEGAAPPGTFVKAVSRIEIPKEEALNINGTPPQDDLIIVSDTPLIEDDTIWTLSSLWYSFEGELPNDSPYNIKFYGQHVKMVTSPGSTTTWGFQCVAYYGDQECLCRRCGPTVNGNELFTVSEEVGGYVYFECDGIHENRLCSGTTAPASIPNDPSNLYEPEDRCYWVEGDFQGLESCAKDAPGSASLPILSTMAKVVVPMFLIGSIWFY